MTNILVADLDNNRIYEEQLDEETASTLGGRLLGLTLYSKYSKEGYKDPLVFATSPANKSNLDILVSGRTTLVGRSPLTGHAYSSNSGGKFGQSLATNGYLALVILGESDAGVYIDIDKKQITSKADKSKRAITYGDSATNDCLYACLFDGTKGGVYGRGGFGKSFVDRNLRGVSYLERNIEELTKEEEVFFTEQNEYLKTKIPSKGLRSFQDQFFAAYIFGLTFEKNFKKVDSRGPNPGIEKLIEQLEVENSTRQYYDISDYVQVASSGEVEITDESGTLRTVKGPHNQSAAILGPNLGVYNLNLIYSLYNLCNAGVDTLSFGTLVGGVMDMATQGDLTTKQTDGIDCSFNEFDSARPEYDPSEDNFKVAVKLLRKITDPEDQSNFTKALRKGVTKFTKEYGHPEYAMQMKGLSFSAYNVVGHQELALLFATSSRGPDHFRGGGLMDMQGNTTAEKVYNLERNGIVCDALGIDRFTRITNNAGLIRKFGELYGISLDEQQFDTLARKTMVLERMLLLETADVKDIDTLPKRILKRMEEKEDLESGQNFKQRFEKNLEEYYALMGFDKQGVPTRETLIGLGIE